MRRQSFSSFYSAKFSKNQANGIIAALIVLAIAMGCTCGKEFNLSNLDKTETNSKSDDNPFAKNSDNNGVPGNDEVAALVMETTTDFSSASEPVIFQHFTRKPLQIFNLPTRKRKQRTFSRNSLTKSLLLYQFWKKPLQCSPSFHNSRACVMKRGWIYWSLMVSLTQHRSRCVSNMNI